MRQFLFLILGVLLAGPVVLAQDKPHDIPISELGTKYRLIGKLREPIATAVTIQGIVVDEPRGYDRGLNVRVERINGRATQEHLQLKVNPFFGIFPLRTDAPPKLKSGGTYELEGFETIDYNSVPPETFKTLQYIPIVPRGVFQRFVYYKAKQIDSIVFAPADFADREALLEGRAVSHDKSAYIVAGDWRLLVDPQAPWPNQSEGKTVEGRGVIRKTDDGKTFRLENGTTRLVRLQDQLGTRVTLRGYVLTVNGEWYLSYRGTDLYVEDLKAMPNLYEKFHLPVQIEGVLDEAMLPALDQVFNSDRQPKKHFIVRQASLKFVDALLAPERDHRW